MTISVLPNLPVTNQITALAGGAYAGANPQLNIGWNEIDTVVTAGDSVMLPPAVAGMQCLISNMGAAGTTGLKIYALASNSYNGNLADQIVAHGATALIAGSTGVSVATGHVTLFVCTTQGVWKQIGDFS